EVLKRANGELEVKIAERTADLQASNARLTAEIHERQQAEDTLRKAQDELVQAGKLAVMRPMRSTSSLMVARLVLAVSSLPRWRKRTVLPDSVRSAASGWLS
ncbi:sensor histidine kinase, partial [Pseudomonas aeruginosa]